MLYILQDSTLDYMCVCIRYCMYVCMYVVKELVEILTFAFGDRESLISGLGVKS
jgi:hypothetical protein